MPTDRLSRLEGALTSICLGVPLDSETLSIIDSFLVVISPDEGNLVDALVNMITENTNRYKVDDGDSFIFKAVTVSKNSKTSKSIKALVRAALFSYLRNCGNVDKAIKDAVSDIVNLFDRLEKLSIISRNKTCVAMPVSTTGYNGGHGVVHINNLDSLTRDFGSGVESGGVLRGVTSFPVDSFIPHTASGMMRIVREPYVNEGSDDGIF